MKVLFDHASPFFLAHGGFQTQIEQTKAALQASGIEVEWLRWWDPAQQGDIIHYFGRPRTSYVKLAQQKGMRVVLSDLLGGMVLRSRARQWTQRLITQAAKRMSAANVASLEWGCYQNVNACIALTAWEASLMASIFGADPGRIHVVPNGVEEVFFQSPVKQRGPWLVCTATITKIKRVVEIAEAAVQAQTPLWVIGKAYAESDPYAQQFFALARQHPKVLRYEGAIHEREKLAQVYREARGFVLLSEYESLSLSALEAAACECRLLLSDLPWARTSFGDGALYCPVANTSRTSSFLRHFYDEVPHLKPPPKPLRWSEVSRQLTIIYESLLKTSR